jgi:hypothetical protein
MKIRMIFLYLLPYVAIGTIHLEIIALDHNRILCHGYVIARQSPATLFDGGSAVDTPGNRNKSQPKQQ